MGLLERLGLGRRDLRAWALYDWANSAVQTTIIAAVFPIYFQKVAAADLPGPVATSRFAWATTWSILIVAVIAPILGAMADYAAVKKKLLAVFLAIGASSTAAMWFIQRGDWMFALVLFVITNVGVAGSIVFYESLLPHLRRGSAFRIAAPACARAWRASRCGGWCSRFHCSARCRSRPRGSSATSVPRATRC